MHREPRLRWPVVAALALHLAGAASLREAAATGLIAAKATTRTAEAEVELEIVELSAVARVRMREPAATRDVHAPARREAPRRKEIRPPRPARPAAETVESDPERGPGIDPPGGDGEVPGEEAAAPPEPPGSFTPGESGWGLSLADRVALAPSAAPAPTSAPRRAALTPESVERGLRSAMREKDESLGLGAPERQIVTQAVRVPLRATPAPSGTHVAYEVVIDRAGLVTAVRRVRASAGDETMWREADRAIAGALLAQRLPVGADAQRSGVRIVVDASILHVLPSGSVDGEWVGDCSPTYEDGDLHGSRPLFDSETFFAVGGSLFGDRATGTCTAYEDPNGKRHIEVRATTTSHFENEPPPPGKPKPARLLPWIKDKKKP